MRAPLLASILATREGNGGRDSALKARLLAHADFVSSLYCSKKLVGHEGCVNTVSWGPETQPGGNLLVSGSDDTRVILWGPCCKFGWAERGRLETGHVQNIFCAEVSPANEAKLATAGLDGEVRLVDVPSERNFLLGEANQMILGLSFIPYEANSMLASGQDGCVRIYDTRASPPARQARTGLQEGPLLVNMATLKGPGQGTWACGLKFHPARPNLFAVGTSSCATSLFDLRMSGGGRAIPVATYIPSALSSPNSLMNCWGNDGVSSLDISATGKLVVNFRGENLFLFDLHGKDGEVDETAGGVTLHRETLTVFKGRRNHDTFLKQVCFLYCGADEYVATGGDNGDMYVWRSQAPPESTAATLLRRVPADSSTLNALAPHPSLPIVATAGIDTDVKMWEVGFGCREDGELATTTADDDADADADEGAHPFSRRLHPHPPIVTCVEAQRRVAAAARLRERGNEEYRRGENETALSWYRSASAKLNFRAPGRALKAARTAAVALVFLNQAACSLKLARPQDAETLCALVLRSEPGNIKARLRRAQALIELKVFDDADEELDSAAKLLAESGAGDGAGGFARDLERLRRENAQKRDTYEAEHTEERLRGFLDANGHHSALPAELQSVLAAMRADIIEGASQGGSDDDEEEDEEEEEEEEDSFSTASGFGRK
mmetsp:Transcript_10385/g.34138  ORF Transcript_10385/g.34138 Transcript_10385/m.34138 type:complete len:668 (+) Transcript_10385:355-2358(+)